MIITYCTDTYNHVDNSNKVYLKKYIYASHENSFYSLNNISYNNPKMLQFKSKHINIHKYNI